MTFRHRIAVPAWIGVVACMVALCNAGVANSAQRGGAVFYVANPSTDFEVMASRYDVFIVDDFGWEVESIRAVKPQAEIYRYNSISDNYVTGSQTAEHEYLEQLAAAKGWDVEDAYLHYYDDTVIRFGQEERFIPGWGGGSALSKEEARIPVYYENLSRRAVHVSTYRGAQLIKETVVGIGIDDPFPDTAVFPDGLFLDNMGTSFWNTGTLVSGGRVLESPGHMVVGTPEYQAWHWNDHWAPFLASLKDTLEVASTWSPDGRNKKLMINVSSSWGPDIHQQDVADVFFLEYQYSPVRNAGDHWVQNSINWDRAAASTGGVMFYSAKPITELSGYAGSVSYEEAQLGNYAWYLVSKTDASLFFQSGTYNAGTPEYETLNWAGCMEVARAQFGDALGEPYVVASGVDPKGYAYKVYGRDYEGGFALLRNRGAWNQDFDAATAVSVPLPESMRPITPSGSLGPAAATTMLANGRGALFLKTDGGPSSEPTSIQDLSHSLRVLATSPDQGAQGVPSTVEIRWLLSDALKTPVESSWVTVSGSASGVVSGAVQLSAEGRLLVFRPAVPFVPGEWVTLTLSSNTRRIDGATLDGDGDGVGSGADDDRVVVTFRVAG